MPECSEVADLGILVPGDVVFTRSVIKLGVLGFQTGSNVLFASHDRSWSRASVEPTRADLDDDLNVWSAKLHACRTYVVWNCADFGLLLSL